MIDRTTLLVSTFVVFAFACLVSAYHPVSGDVIFSSALTQFCIAMAIKDKDRQ